MLLFLEVGIVAGHKFAAQEIQSILLRPDEVLSRIANPAILEVAHNTLRGTFEHRHVFVGRFA